MTEWFLSVLASLTASALFTLVRWVTALIAPCKKVRHAKHKRK